ncbi:hypothetical protein [Paraburkholderia susongensis]|uniref:Uncharacterized protein n=1 Tax=Paraburkholderia susongensis TaxID=1515439 RepID=A0A1X7IEC7_9BURK|nr:hypothetical protein [Paraburkholderia susongensis]SMG12537.1 hypothetical protein SAMN06265784_101574 [Paraburkholderia susongensis]
MNDTDLPGGASADASDAQHDTLLAYLRGELSVAQTRALAMQLTTNPALRDELEWLRALAQQTTDDYVDASATDAFARLQAALGSTAAASALASAPARSSAVAPAASATSAASSTAASAAKRSVPHTPNVLTRLRNWLRSAAPALQPALLLLVIAQAGALGYLVSGEHRVSETTPLVRGAGASCLDVWITPRADASVQALRDWLLQYGGSLAAGPDPDGRLRVALPDAEARAAFLHDPAAARVAQRVDDVSACQSPSN